MLDFRLALAILSLLAVMPSAAGAASREIPLPAATQQRLVSARDGQDVAALEKLLGAVGEAKAEDLYLRALSSSYVAEVQLEKGDKAAAAAAARRGIEYARQALRQSDESAEFHRILGTLCGQMIPANLFSALEFGRCAQEEIATALAKNPQSAYAHLSRGVGNYYLPESFGGGMSKAIADFRRATELDPQLGDAWLWLGLALRKQRDFGGAHRAFARAKELSPQRAWLKLQIEKTPAAAAKP